ncbi:MAG TPA: diguanylate cyclase [Chloroflexota bacterium]
MDRTRFQPFILVFAVYAVLMAGLTYIAPLVVTAMLGATLVTAATAGWGLNAGTGAAIWSSAILLWQYMLTPTIEAESLLLAIFVNLLIALGMGKAIDAVRNHRDALKASFDQLRRAEEELRSSQERYKELVENQGEGIVTMDLAGRFIFANPAAHSIFGVGQGGLIGSGMADFLDGAEAGALGVRAGEVQADGKQVHEIEIVRADGERKAILLTATPQRDQAGKVIGTFGVLRDVTDQRRAEKALEEANRSLTRWVADLEKRTRESELLTEMGELLQSCLEAEEAREVIGRSLPRLLQDHAGVLFTLNDSKDLLEGVTRWGNPVLWDGAFSPGDCWCLRRGHAHLVEDPAEGLRCRHTGEDFDRPHFCLPLVAHGETLGVLYLEQRLGDGEKGFTEDVKRLAVTVAEHVSLALANLNLRETLRNQAMRDPLTGLYNRAYMEKILDRELMGAVRTETPLAVMMLDIDEFKRYNDVYGHDAGDILLQRLGNHLKTQLRDGDVACRYGGEEFTLIMPRVDGDVALRRAEELRQSVKRLETEHRGQHLGSISVSVGIAVFPEHGDRGGLLLRTADTALYRAKAEGRDRAVLAG